MAKVTCTRHNASEHISGVDFVRQKDGSVVAEDVSPELAEQFADFEGFTVEDEKESGTKGEDEKESGHKKKSKADPVA